MAGPTEEEKLLIHYYEPVLFFDPGERFFPSDVKRYVERCALYRATVPADPNDAPSWQEPPELAAEDGRATRAIVRSPSSLCLAATLR